MKAGIEFVEGRPRISCVVTNGFSDWSTQLYDPEFKMTPKPPAEGETTEPITVQLELKVHRVRGDSIVFEAASPLTEGKISMIRIAHLKSHGEDKWFCGPFAASPMKGGGCVSQFTEFAVSKYEGGEHSDNL